MNIFTNTALLTRAQNDVMDLDTMLHLIEKGQIALNLGDTFRITLKDESTDVDLVVTDQDKMFVRFESRDCVGEYITGNQLRAFTDKMYDLLPDALQAHIVDAFRMYINGGSLCAKQVKLFVPTASEIFDPNENNSLECIYDQLEWYKNPRNRIRLGHCGRGISCCYWTESEFEANDACNSIVGSAGNAGARERIKMGAAPFCFLIKKDVV